MSLTCDGCADDPLAPDSPCRLLALRRRTGAGRDVAAADDAAGRRSRGRRARGSRTRGSSLPATPRASASLARRYRRAAGRAPWAPTSCRAAMRARSPPRCAVGACSSSPSRTSSAARASGRLTRSPAARGGAPAVVEDGPRAARGHELQPEARADRLEARRRAIPSSWAAGSRSIGARSRRGRARDGDGRGGRRAHERARDRGDLAGDDRHQLRHEPLLRRHRPPDQGGRSGAATTCST